MPHNSLKKLLKKITRSEFVTQIISTLIYWYTLLVYKTTSWEIKGRDEFFEHVKKKPTFILVAWHGRALMLPPFCERRITLNALVSQHNDGRLIAGLLHKYGFGTVNGSSNNNAKGAAVGLMHSLNAGMPICIIPDGPRGPRMKLSMSPIYYAQKTGLPIIAMTYSIKNCRIAAKAWDKMMIPLPFSKGIMVMSEPIYIPECGNEETENYRLKIETILNQINFNADKAMGLEPVLPDTNPKKSRKGK